MEMANPQPRYEVRCGKDWVRCKYARLTGIRGWLEYELADGTVGLTGPDKWRKVGPDDKEKAT